MEHILHLGRCFSGCSRRGPAAGWAHVGSGLMLLLVQLTRFQLLNGHMLLLG